MRNKISVSLLTLVVCAVYFMSARVDSRGRPADFRDAPRDSSAMGQLDLGQGLTPAIPSPTPAQGPVIVKSPVYVHSTKLEKIIKKVRPGVVKVMVSGGSGSGFFIIPSGIVCTNAHVVENVPVGEKVFILAEGDEVYSGLLLAKGKTLKRDIAFVQVAPGKSPWKSLPLKPAAQLAIGTEILVMGHPLGLPFTVSRGIVSGLDRKNEYITYTQTDAAVNPGNSGGPMFTLDGAVVGMNTMGMRPAGGATGSVGLNFAIISDDIDRAWKQYLKLKNLDTPWLGVILDPGGAVMQVLTDSPAKKAGIGLDDVIMAIDGKQSKSMADFLHHLRSYMPGDTVKVTVKRAGALMELPVLLEPERAVPPMRIAVSETDTLPV